MKEVDNGSNPDESIMSAMGSNEEEKNGWSFGVRGKKGCDGDGEGSGDNRNCPIAHLPATKILSLGPPGTFVGCVGADTPAFSDLCITVDGLRALSSLDESSTRCVVLSIYKSLASKLVACLGVAGSRRYIRALSLRPSPVTVLRTVRRDRYSEQGMRTLFTTHIQS